MSALLWDLGSVGISKEVPMKPYSVLNCRSRRCVRRAMPPIPTRKNMPSGPYVKIRDRYRHPDQSGLSLMIQNGAQVHDIVLVPEAPAFPA